MTKTTKTKQPFKYTAEIQELLDIPEVNGLEFSPRNNITNSEYTRILKPLYEWLIKLKAMGKLNFTVEILRCKNNNKMELMINISSNMLHITIPPQITHITLNYFESPETIQYVVCTNPKSLLVNELTYKQLVSIACYGSLHPNHELYMSIERLGLKLLKQYRLNIKKVIDNKIEARNHHLTEFNEIKLVYLFELLRQHHKKCGYQDTRNSDEVQQIIRSIKDADMYTVLSSKQVINNYYNTLSTIEHELKRYMIEISESHPEM